MSVVKSWVRTARKDHQCGTCRHVIKKGEQYRETKASPGWADLGYDSWLRLKECAECCKRYGREVA